MPSLFASEFADHALGTMRKKNVKSKFEIDKTPIGCELRELQPLRFVQVFATPLEDVWDCVVSEYHYLGYDKMIGPRLKYLVLSELRILAAVSFNQASYKVGCRDGFIGWDDNQRKKSLSVVVNNNRFLIPPWVNVKNLASHVLSKTVKLLRSDWTERFRTEPLLVETFVDANRYKGVCYRAANWIYLGETKGYARKGGAYAYHGNRKVVYAYPLRDDFRNIIGCAERHARTLNPTENGRLRKMMIQSCAWNPRLTAEAGITAEEVGKLGRLLLAYHNGFKDCYRHKNQATFGLTYLTGLMSNLERKSAEPIALRYLGKDDVRGLQRFFKNSPWDYDGMKALYQSRLSSKITDPGGMITLDPTDFPKKGKESAGVARQHCGSLGKTENCQAGVFAGYTGGKGYGLVDCGLYVPEKWFGDDHKDRRKACAFPEDLKFRTKIEIGTDLVKGIKESGLFPAKWLGCDSFFGRNAAFLDGVADDFWYFADLLGNMLVFPLGTVTSVPESAGGRRRKPVASADPVAVSAFASDDAVPWVSVNLGEGAKGPITAEVKCVRVFEHRAGLPGRESWLYIRRFADGKIKYSLSNAPADTPIEELHRASLMRWPIEQCFEECKSNLGMDHYEIRSYPGWHRHMLFVFLAQLFLLEVRLMFKKNTRSDAFAGEDARCGRCGKPR